jgi:hypothetical protein
VVFEKLKVAAGMGTDVSEQMAKVDFASEYIYSIKALLVELMKSEYKRFY